MGTVSLQPLDTNGNGRITLSLLARIESSVQLVRNCRHVDCHLSYVDVSGPVLGQVKKMSLLGKTNKSGASNKSRANAGGPNQRH